jgi:hypothetical protein
MMSNEAQHTVLILLLAAMLSGCGTCDNSESGWRLDTSVPDASGGDAGDTVEEVGSQDSGVDADSDATDPRGLPPAEERSCGESEEVSCPIQEPTGFGDCDQPIGAVFDGIECVAVSGCDCDGQDCPAFDSVEACAEACGRAGWCQSQRLPRTLLSDDSGCPDTQCGQGVAMCSDGSEAPSDTLQRLIPSINSIDCVEVSRSDGYDCVAAGVPCYEGEWCCTLPIQRIRKSEYSELCRATLLPDFKPGAGCIDYE